MKTSLSLSSGSRRGIALVVVLAFLVLTAMVVIGFFARTVNLRKATAQQQAAGNARVLADTVVNLVQGQIDHATSTGSEKTWASQPGAVRLFDASGNLERIYRLYSAPDTTATAAADLAADLPPANWATLPGQWVDLNAPATLMDSGGQQVSRFPVLDPRDPNDPNDTTKTNPTEGFTLTNVPGTTPQQQAPMPVRWMYVLRDGTLSAGQLNPNGDVQVPGADATNPITGRIAFWTDDDTCRVNINTAAGAAFSGNGAPPTFWDTPRFLAPDEVNRSIFSPAAKEFQRYPGHPATTTLSKVFPSLTSQQLLDLTPRYRFGGSEDGTKDATQSVAAKTERLYSAVGELLFDQSRAKRGPAFNLSERQLESARFFLTAHSRSPEVTLFGTPRVSMWPVHTDSTKRTPTDGLLAFASRVNGKDYHFKRTDPKSATTDISITRNNVLLNYLDTLTSKPIPGFGGNFNQKYAQDRRDILVKSFDYIRSTNLEDPSLPVAQRYTTYYEPQSLWQNPSGLVASNVVVPAKHPTWTDNGNPGGQKLQGLGRFPVINEVALWLVAVGQGAPAGNGTAVPVPLQQAGAKGNPNNPVFWVPPGPGVTANSTPAAGRVAVQAYFVFGLFDPAQGWGAISAKTLVRVRGLDGLKVDIGGQTYPLGMPSDAAVRNWQSSLTNNKHGHAWGGSRGFRDFLLAHGTGWQSPPLTYIPLGPNPIGADRFYPFYSNILSLPQNGQMRLVPSGLVTLEIYADPGAGLTASNLVSSYQLDLSSLAQSAGSAPAPLNMPIPTLGKGGKNSFGLPLSIPWTDKTGDRAGLLTFSGPTASEDSIPQEDTFWSMVPTGAGIAGDYRLLSKPLVPSAVFTRHSAVASGTSSAFDMKFGAFFTRSKLDGRLVKNIALPSNLLRWETGLWPSVPSGINGVTAANNGSTPGDWDNGFGRVSDGPYINKADEGTKANANIPGGPYFAGNAHMQNLIPGALFSPNRMIPSAGMLGSLPTGVISGRPWQTLLFRPGPTDHVGTTSPHDHLFLDLFWMPVAEPYAISEPFSTNGKVNLNYQIQPFTYIKRNTALRSVLASEAVARVPASQASVYKTTLNSTPGMTSNARLPISLDETRGALRQFEEKFSAGDVFRSGTEICDIFLPPTGTQWSSDAAARTAWYGDDFALVGDNVRERPYANLLGRVTTKSNTFTVYYTVQSLKVPPQQPQDTWVENRGVVLSEYRGSTTLERYLDPNDTSIPDYASNPNAPSLDQFYRWRVIQNSQFAP
jgi:type II secretory pathway pseudopilin PulG